MGRLPRELLAAAREAHGIRAAGGGAGYRRRAETRRRVVAVRRAKTPSRSRAGRPEQARGGWFQGLRDTRYPAVADQGRRSGHALGGRVAVRTLDQARTGRPCPHQGTLRCGAEAASVREEPARGRRHRAGTLAGREGHGACRPSPLVTAWRPASGHHVAQRSASVIVAVVRDRCGAAVGSPSGRAKRDHPSRRQGAGCQCSLCSARVPEAQGAVRRSRAGRHPGPRPRGRRAVLRRHRVRPGVQRGPPRSGRRRVRLFAPRWYRALVRSRRPPPGIESRTDLPGRGGRDGLALLRPAVSR